MGVGVGDSESERESEWTELLVSLCRSFRRSGERWRTGFVRRTREVKCCVFITSLLSFFLSLVFHGWADSQLSSWL